MMEFGLVALWLFAYLALLLIGVQITSGLLGTLAERGAGVAIPAALSIIWLVTYVVGRFSITIGLWIGIGVLGLVAFAARYRGGRIDQSVCVETAIVFTAAFLFLVAIRALDPAVHPGGGEKFLDFGLLKSLLLAETLPPEDVWFAGEPVNYYYGGHLLTSLLARMTNTSARFAYNLAHAGYYAMLVTAAYGLAKSIAVDRHLPGRVTGGVAAFFVGFASNLHIPAKSIVLALPESMAEGVSSVVGVELRGVAVSISQFDYWYASRIIPGTINEFPLFAWLNGDMHAHMMSTPFLLLGATLLYGYYRTPEGMRGRRLALLAALGPLAAMLAVVNTWSFPSIGGLTVLTVAMAPAQPSTLLPTSGSHWVTDGKWLRQELARHAIAVLAGVAVLLVGVALSLPFWLQAASGQRGIGLFPSRSGLGLLIVHGAFVVVFALYYYRYHRSLAARPRLIWGLLAALLAISIIGDTVALVLFVPLVFGGWLLSRIEDDNDLLTPGFESILIVGGAGLAVLVEFIYVKELAGPGRMNTVFKVYMQVWVLWGTAMGVALVGLIADRRPHLTLKGKHWRRAFSVLAVVLVVGTSMYGGLALSEHHAEGNPDAPTLDALEFVASDHPGEAPAIHWLDANVEGQPNMVSKPGTDIYRWVNAPASLSGIPTVAGWNHEVGYRGTAAYGDRVEDVDTIFTGPPVEQRRLLAEYDVEYVYVGPLEERQYPSMSIQELEAVTVERSWESVTIYGVDQALLNENGE